MGPKKEKKKTKKLSKAQKAKLKKKAAELKAKQEEEERLQKEKDERERKEREAKEKAERKLLEEKERGLHQDKINELNQLLEENNNILKQYKKSKLKTEKWEKYMLCEERPNISNYKEMNTFISLLSTDENMVNIKYVLEKCDLIVKLAKECGKSAEDIMLENAIVEEMGEASLMSLQKYNELKDALHSLIIIKIDAVTKNLLEQPVNIIDSETLNITSENQSQSFKICLWGNTGKNPRVKQITFQNDKFTMELPKFMALADVALRVIYMKLDIFSIQCPTFSTKINVQNILEVSKETTTEGHPINANQCINVVQTISGDKEISTNTDENNLLEAIIDLRQYHPIGSIFIVDLFELPNQAKVVKGWNMQQVNYGKLKIFTYNKDENPSPLVLTVSIDENIVLYDTPQIAHWDSLTKQWKTNGISDAHYDKEQNLLFFRTDVLGPFALMQDVYYNMPFQYWSVCPLALNKCILKVVGVAMEIFITIKDELCCVSFPKDNHHLHYLNDRWVTPKELIELLRSSGINIFPYEDGYKYIDVSQKDIILLKSLYQQMSLLACSFSFCWSKWNSFCDEENVVLQATEWISSNESFEHPEMSDYHLYLATTRICCKLKANENADAFSNELFPETNMLPDLYHTLRKEASNAVRARIKETSVLFVECVNELLSASNLLVYS
ncbi:dynein axonemal intermediate chain 7 isoform X3 [Hydra vulgaris]|uniref:Dynein axonemal intermediate chain 7 isoform X3 n=1 Tax=Hydra vulgaris TaxID=6087 RepID=A0ABM4BD06_HYDVU